MKHTNPTLSVLLLALVPVAAIGQQPMAAPPNAPATVEWKAGEGKLRLRYHNSVVLDAVVRAEDAAGRAVAGIEAKVEPSGTSGEKIEQRLKFTPATPREGVVLVLRGTVSGSEEAFPAETEIAAQSRFPLVRNSVGLSRNLRNNAVYDRRWDWVLSGSADGATRILPKSTGKEHALTPGPSPRRKGEKRFGWESGGPAIELVFRPRFYQKHKEQVFFEPWTYRVWKDPIVGYCSWWPYRNGISQQVVDELTDVFAAKRLPDYGYRYLQLDAGYSGGAGGPRSFLEWNENKFPDGADGAIKKIRSAGMKPGIWVHRVYRSYIDKYLPEIGKQHPDWFVRKTDGTIYQGGFGIWTLNTANKEAVDNLVRPLFHELKKQEWDYVKIDGAGDMLYSDKQEPAAEHFQKVGITPEESLRNWDRVAREELGRDIFILSCWGVGPGRVSVGLVDGVRLGSDGFQWKTMLGESMMNGVLWRGDPDHCDILPEREGERPTMKTFGVGEAITDTIIRPAVVAMAGSMLLVSDKAHVYEDDANLEGMKRSSPVLFTVPGQLHNDVGNGTWWLQEIDRPFDHWCVLARFNWDTKADPEREVQFADLGLHPDREYLVFEFWTQTFLGKFTGSFIAPAMDENNGMQVFAIREAREYPWVLSTTRHLSQGGVSLLDEQWDAGRKTLLGRSAVVAGDPYVLTVHLPSGFRVKTAEVGGEKAGFANEKDVATVRIVPKTTTAVDWQITFAD